MNFKVFIETWEDWERFLDDHFVDELDSVEMRSDFYNWMRRKKLAPDAYAYDRLKLLFKDWFKSKTRGRNADIFSRKRRAETGPGRFWGQKHRGDVADGPWTSHADRYYR